MPTRPHLILALCPWAASCAVAVLLSTNPATAGPPYTTDDPETVKYRQWEVYLATSASHGGATWSGTGPGIEVNYGLLPDLQLHVIAPLSFTSTASTTAGASPSRHYGYGDTELGLKVRFVHESDHVPQIGLFTLVELPTGRAALGLGAGYAQVFLPLWAQKSFGPWTAYGGGGVWIEGTPGHQDYGFVGAHLERKLGESLSLGAEVFHTTPHGADAPAETHLNGGAVVNVGEHHHLMLSAGPGLQGPGRFQGYLAYQLTFGPKVR